MDIEHIAAEDEWVLIGVHSKGRGKASGVPVEVSWSAAFRVREGMIGRVDVHGDWAKALAVAGRVE